MIHLEKVLYTAKAHTTGGRDGGASRTSDGHLDVKLSTPGTSGDGTDPSSFSPLVGRLVSLAQSSLWPAK
jgi:organic hydroperoxide reductase OsmC/OhrA